MSPLSVLFGRYGVTGFMDAQTGRRDFRVVGIRRRSWFQRWRRQAQSGEIPGVAVRGDVAIFRQAYNQQNRLGTAQLRSFSNRQHLRLVWRARIRKAFWMEVPFAEVVKATPPNPLQKRVQTPDAAPERRWARNRISRRVAGAMNKRDLVRVVVPTDENSARLVRVCLPGQC